MSSGMLYCGRYIVARSEKGYHLCVVPLLCAFWHCRGAHMLLRRIVVLALVHEVWPGRPQQRRLSCRTTLLQHHQASADMRDGAARTSLCPSMLSMRSGVGSRLQKHEHPSSGYRVFIGAHRQSRLMLRGVGQCPWNWMGCCGHARCSSSSGFCQESGSAPGLWLCKHAHLSLYCPLIAYGHIACTLSRASADTMQ